MKRMFLDNLPKWGKSGKGNEGKIDWKKSIGFSVKFICDDIEGKLVIRGYDAKSRNLTVDYNNGLYTITHASFLKCNIGKVLKTRTGEFKVEIGTTLKNEKRNLTIIDNEYRCASPKAQKYKYYKYKCNKCGWAEGWIEESNLISGKGCSCCYGRTTVLGINAICDTDKWMCDLGVSEEDAKKYTKGSNKYIMVKCPDCGKGKKIKISTIYNCKTIGCVCGDGFSYPEKFICNLLKQLNVDFETQYSPNYIKPKRSDFHLPEYKLVIEVDGRLGHEGGIVHSKSSKSLAELIKIDNWKDEQHLKHGVKTIRVNCFESNMDYIKENMLNSELSKMFDLSKIDWLKCEEFALKNIAKEVCYYWNNKRDDETIADICKVFGISATPIYGYLNAGAKLGWCDYDGQKEYLASLEKMKLVNSKRVRCEEDNLVFCSIAEAGRYYDIASGSISQVCLGKRKSAGGRKFTYVK